MKTEQEKRDQFYIDPKTDGTEKFHEYLRRAPETLCLYPATHINFKADGAMSSCFRAANLGNIKNIDPNEFWNSDRFKTIRKNMINGIKSPECGDCWKMEETGGFSNRKESIADLGVHAQWRGQFEGLQEDGTMPYRVKQAELRFSNLCNLQCRMCCPIYSSKWESDMNKKSDIWSWHVNNKNYTDVEQRMKETEFSSQKILDFISQSAPYLEYLMITGGEPFIDTTHIKALEILKPYAKNITLEYTTNLNTLTKSGFNVLDYWEDFKQVRLKVSIDGDPAIYDYVRYGGKIEAVMSNAKKIFERYPIQNKTRYRTFPDEKVVIIGTCTVSVYNVARLPEIASFVTQLGALFHSSQVNYPPFLSSQILPQSIKDEITLRTTAFIEDLENQLEWGPGELWKSEDARGIQLRRIYRWIKNSIHHMNGKDSYEKYFAKFLDHERVFNKSKNISSDVYESFLDAASIREFHVDGL